jgi:bisphosphoglycerate-dependent phosphoglycerate mutase
MKKPCEIVLVRHGETAWNKEGRLQGQQEPGPPLDDLGHQQAAVVGANCLLCSFFPLRQYSRVRAVVSHTLDNIWCSCLLQLRRQHVASWFMQKHWAVSAVSTVVNE